MYPAVALPGGRASRIMRLLSMKLSIVTSLYRSEPYVAEFHRRIRAVAAEITSDCEVIYVNDGSPDEALAVALRLMEEDDQLVVVDLAIIAP
jgi:putative glycosyltransferase